MALPFILAAFVLQSPAASFTPTRSFHNHISYVSPTRLSVEQSLGEDETSEDVDTDIDQRELLRSLSENIGQYDGRLPTKHDDFRCGFVSILGAANMGKSSLLNALLEEDLCVATRRPQTTRHAILGVLTTDDCQLCLVDTPGIIGEPAYKLQEGMMEAVMGAFYDADVLMVVTDLFSTPIPNDDIFGRVKRSTKPIVVVINKVDLADKVNRNSEENENEGRTVTVADAVAKWRSLLPNALAIIPTSAAKGTEDPGIQFLRKLLVGGEGVPASIRGLGRPIPGMFPPNTKFVTDAEAKALLPFGPALYDEEFLTDKPERFFASEIIRGALFETLKKELPYCCEAQIDSFKEPKENDAKPITRIAATIYVERDSQKQIVIGRNGNQIKEIGSKARRKLEDFLQCKVFLELVVKVNKDWRHNEEELKKYGYLKK